MRVQFSFAGLSGKPGSGLGDPMKVSPSDNDLSMPLPTEGAL